jgi:tRNA1Val (adenine37-N6)-methyltransferase
MRWLMTDRPAPTEDESLDQITRDWWIFQLRKGHRFSTDDSVTAWTAGMARPDATRLIDIGAGLGSVGLMTLHFMGPDANSVFVEAQEVSHHLSRKTIDYNDLGHRVELRLGDLREEGSAPESGSFDLVTGSPPYTPVENGVMSSHPQRAACRMELRGSVFDYCRTAARLMKPDGTFVFVHTAHDPRPEQAIIEAGLTLNERRDVVFRDGRPPTIAVFRCSFGGERRDAPAFIMRTAEGDWGPDRELLREAVGLKG